jgi:hypothetical protein
MSEEAEITSRFAEVDHLLSRKDKTGALNLILLNPLGSKSDQAKVSDEDSSFCTVDRLIGCVCRMLKQQ